MLQQDFRPYTIFTTTTLTGSYVAGNIIGNATDFPTAGAHFFNQLELLINYSQDGTTTDTLIKIEFSVDNTNWFQESLQNYDPSGTDTVAPLVHKLSSTGTYRLPLPIKGRYIKISVKGEGTPTTSTIAITAVIGTV